MSSRHSVQISPQEKGEVCTETNSFSFCLTYLQGLHSERIAPYIYICMHYLVHLLGLEGMMEDLEDMCMEEDPPLSAPRPVGACPCTLLLFISNAFLN